MSESVFFQMRLKHVPAIAGKTRVDVDRYKLIIYRRSASQRFENMKQGVRVFAAGNADGDPVAFIDKIEVAYGFAYVSLDAVIESGFGQ